ncbi:putative exocyst complex component Exo70, cullin repeat-like-containing domain superfamily [Helianthus annuus]|nr:putative exocyst complex component Exo70, cullin repeat-like-containing domain superfamily [Helianthus annuus]
MPIHSILWKRLTDIPPLRPAKRKGKERNLKHKRTELVEEEWIRQPLLNPTIHLPSFLHTPPSSAVLPPPMATTTVQPKSKDRVLATAHQIVKSLNINTQATEDMINIFSRFDNRLSNITDLIQNDAKFNDQFRKAEKIILHHDSDASPEQEQSSDYLAAVDVIDRAENALQLAMSKLEDDFRHALIHNTVPLDADRLYGSVRSVSRPNLSNNSEIEDEIEGELDRFVEDEQEGSTLHHERGASLGGDLCVDLIRVEAIDELKEIADRMIRSGYEKECCQVYTSVRRDVLDECLMILGVERLSIEEVQRIEWKIMDEKLKKWILALKVVVRVLLFGEKRLCETIFNESELVQEICFVETTKSCVMQLLNFGEAVAISPRSSEKLFRILDMYEVVGDVLHDLEALFVSESGELVCSEAKGVLNGLGMTAVGTFIEFENAVKGENSKAMQNGDIHPLTRYVMNYLKLLVDYSDSMNTLLPKNDYDPSSSPPENSDGVAAISPIATRVQELIASLQSNVDEKSRLYEDSALRYVFLMNNVLYIVQKVKESELRNLLGDQWIRKHRGKIRQWHTSYLRAAWGKALLCLKDEGIGGSSSGASKMILKERFKNFNACFEDIYRIQTLWKVSDAQLKEELRISISEKVLPAYRAFLGRFGSRLESARHGGRYIKYYPDDLENYLLDLFEGKPVVMNLTKRKST